MNQFKFVFVPQHVPERSFDSSIIKSVADVNLNSSSIRV